MYELTIVKLENLTEEEKKEMHDRRDRGRVEMDGIRWGEMREQHRAVGVLSVTITDEEFQAVKKAVVEVM